MSDDLQLLRSYVARGADAEDAFASLVRRHVDLVYSVALRTARSPHHAEDVVQSVFVDLATRAAAFPPGTPLVAWLHVVTRRTAIDLVRRESRRQAREQAASVVAMNPVSTPWELIEPLLEEAVESLPPADRTAILLRFLENRSLREVGATLGLGDDAAQKRVSRALERLRTYFVRRGVTVTASGLAAELCGHAVVTAPASLAGSALSAALAGGSAATATTVVFSAGAKFLLAASAAGIAALVLFQTLSSDPAPTARQVTTSAPVSPATPVPTVSTIPPPQPVPPAVLDDRVALLRQLIAELPAQGLPELRLLVPADWIAVARAHELDSAADIRLALADLRAVARRAFAPHLQEALRRFAAASEGRNPATMADLEPLLEAPGEPEMLARYDLIPDGHADRMEGYLLVEKPSSDARLAVGLDGWFMRNNADHPPGLSESATDAIERTWRALGTAIGPEMQERMSALPSPRMVEYLMQGVLKELEPVFGDADAFGAAMKDAVRSYVAVNPGRLPEDLGQILPFLRHADQLTAPLRVAFARLAYLRDHRGVPPADPVELRPYLDQPFDPAAALRMAKLTWDGETLTTTFSWNIKAVDTRR